ncbi:MAG: PP2C family protein-serine/threonine phosphatase [Acidobacteriota bacterium]
MSTENRSSDRPPGIRSFVRTYTDGLRRRDLKRLFDREAIEAYDILVRDQDVKPPEKGGVRLFFHRARVLFLGLSYKLTPERRLLFAFAVITALFGALDFGAVFNFRNRIVFETSPVWFLFSILALAFLLALTLVDQVRFRDELEIARQLQRDLLPAQDPAIDGYTVSHVYRTAKAVGGDYYDFHRLEDGRWAIMVGDASGHGMAAGLLMAIANATLKLAMDIDPRPVPVLEMLNRALYRTGDARAFMTLFYGVLDVRTGDLDYAIAAHPFPILRRSNGDLVELGTGALPLGLRPELKLEKHHVKMDVEDLIVIYSDGLPEAVNPDERSFGYDKLMKILRVGGQSYPVRERILFALEQHMQGSELQDDFSLVVLKRQPELPPLPKV